MIYCSSFAQMGRLGNMLMRLMTIISFSKKYNTDYAIPHWKYAQYFDSVIPQKTISASNLVKEPAFHYTPEVWNSIDWNKQINLFGWFQSWKYWEPYKQDILSTLKFKESFIGPLKQKYKEVFSKEVVAISVRRGDFVGNKNYYQLPLEYYTGAMKDHFSGDYNFFVFSDDINWCKQNVTGCYFAEGSDIEQMALMTQCNHFIISNSTFSYCGAYLSETNGKVIRPKYNLAGPLAERKSEKDYWPEDWIIYEHEKLKPAVIVYHKNLSTIYPKQWVQKFKDSILRQTHQGFDILELNYGGTGDRIFANSQFESIEMPTFAYAMNHLLDKCKEYDCVFNTNTDDWYSENRFEKQLNYIRQEYDIVSSNFSLVKENRVTLTHHFDKRDIEKELARDHNMLCHPVIAYSKKFIESERYNPEEIPYEDMNLWKRTVSKYKFIILPDVLCFHRLHKKSVGHNLKEVS